MLFLAQNSWLRYFTELSNSNNVPSDTALHAGNSSEVDFEHVLQRTIAEYGALRDHLEILERKLHKMLEIKEAKARNDYEVAKRNLALSEKEVTIVRRIMDKEKGLDDDDVTVRAERFADADDAARGGGAEADPKAEDIVIVEGEKILPHAPVHSSPRTSMHDVEHLRQRLAEEQALRNNAEELLSTSRTQQEQDLHRTRAALQTSEAARVKAENQASEEARARSMAENEVHRLRSELRLVGMDAKQNSVAFNLAGGSAAGAGSANAAERRDAWLESRTGEELQDIQNAVGRAIESYNKRRAMEAKKRKLSKRLKSGSTDVIALSRNGSTANIVPVEANA
ncbi:SubName: Full=Uncharacterized protein {ECO:0000313/EMBL:CCA73910.1} [Serendipita indica DSM 11827]|uniref:Uncharacterized protein n=1 Tax=Serendipita indica (strain DSM 11827) TaxID=1109443 RepID=G4TRH7_SERID|nr:SubName: Full=Uncharacterized protein {ECO:0000313/EMBL:CCA73910.1} [Serendipita indica DSM 11827]CCA73910.1 hypothetical protein PIIN_07863 [Serendipita indica DSM 11827]